MIEFLDEGQLEQWLLDEKEIFELVWSEDEYKKIIESYMLSLPNPNNRIKYPKF